MTGRKLGLRKRIGLRLFSDLYAEKIAEHKLRTLFWECTLRCNLACRHCNSVSDRYIELYEHIVGEKFVKAEGEDVAARIEKHVTDFLNSRKK